jgi:hypothetical protein
MGQDGVSRSCSYWVNRPEKCMDVKIGFMRFLSALFR